MSFTELSLRLPPCLACPFPTGASLGVLREGLDADSLAMASSVSRKGLMAVL